MAGDQGWQVIRNDPNVWRMLIDRAARTLCYVFCNVCCFTKSVRRKFERVESASSSEAGQFRRTNSTCIFKRRFKKPLTATGDYETLFYPAEKDWAGPLILVMNIRWTVGVSVLENLRPFNFKEIRTDILGGIFKKLIAPEERHKFGQHYTNEDLVDVVKCLLHPRRGANMLDPAGGSGSFVVRGYTGRPGSNTTSVSNTQRVPSRLAAADLRSWTFLCSRLISAH